MSTKLIFIFTVSCLLFSGIIPESARAQLDNSYFKADQLLQQQKYEEAYKHFEQLFDEYPDTYIVLEKTTECLINLKEYEKAIDLVKRGLERGHYQAQGNIRLGEIYHIRGDTTRAFETWDRALELFGQDNLQVHLTLARTMEERRAFDRAIEIYLKSRSRFPNAGMITSELANAYLQAGKYEESIREFLQLVKDNPERISYVQTRLIRFQDDYVYDVAILEIGDFLDELSGDHPSRPNLHQLELWLLMERGLHERALITAKNYEERSSNINYMLYSIGAKLLAEQKFSLADRAYSWYIDNEVRTVKFRSMEELAGVYIAWAKYLEDYNLAFSTRRDSLYRKAFDTLDALKKAAPGYRRMNRVLRTQAELALDVLHKPDLAEKYLDEMNDYSDPATAAQRDYIDGRIRLYEREYNRARLALSRSNKKKGTGDLAEKTRYYLALTDFFSGDYEFAKIQLNAIERQNSSYFANDAVQLRLWIQEGLQADSTGGFLQPFARAVEHFMLGNRQMAVNTLQEIIRPDARHPLADEALLRMSTRVEADLAGVTYRGISRFLESRGRGSPLSERLMWEKARIADRIITGDTDIERFWKEDPGFSGDSDRSGLPALPETKDELVTLYENILMEFPDGFYASHARERIEELQNIQI